MKRLALLLCLCLTSCMGQYTFTDPFVSTEGEATVVTESKGQLLTISTNKGFSWLISDVNDGVFEMYATLICVSDGSTTDIGLAQRVDGGYPTSYIKGSQMMPLLGKGANLITDTFAWYSPTKPVRGNGGGFGIPPAYSVGNTLYFNQATTTREVTINGQSTGPAGRSGTKYGFGFELVNCGKAVWCIQDSTQYGASPGDCDPGNAAPTCPVSTTCANPTDKTDCSSATNFFINDFTCLTQCPTNTDGLTDTLVKTGVTACAPCTSPCSSCSGTSNTCTACIDGYSLYGHKCLTAAPTPAPAPATITSASKGIAGWKLGLAIGLPVAFILVATIFIYMKLAAKKVALKKTKRKNFENIYSDPISPVTETKPSVETQP